MWAGATARTMIVGFTCEVPSIRGEPRTLNTSRGAGPRKKMGTGLRNPLGARGELGLRTSYHHAPPHTWPVLRTISTARSMRGAKLVGPESTRSCTTALYLRPEGEEDGGGHLPRALARRPWPLSLETCPGAPKPQQK